jgi:hypothetical protein
MLLVGSKQFAIAAKIQDGVSVEIELENRDIISRVFKIDTDLKGTIAILNTFDEEVRKNSVFFSYRFNRTKIRLVGNAQ